MLSKRDRRERKRKIESELQRSQHLLYCSVKEKCSSSSSHRRTTAAAAAGLADFISTYATRERESASYDSQREKPAVYSIVLTRVKKGGGRKKERRRGFQFRSENAASQQSLKVWGTSILRYTKECVRVRDPR